MKVSIIGGGEIGYALAKDLAADHEVFVVDNDAVVGERFAALDVQFIHGSATSSTDLRRAQVEEADFLVAATGLDEVNIVSCSIANSLGDPETICIVSNDDLHSPIGERDTLRQHFGIDRIIWPEGQLAADIERVVAAPGAIDAEVFAGGQVRLLEYRLAEDSALAGRDVADLGLPHGALLVGLKREDEFSHQIEGGKAHLLAVLEEGQGKVLELVVPAGFQATALRDLRPPDAAIVGAILRHGAAVVPRGSDVIYPGDHLLVVATADSADSVRDFFSASA